MKKNIRNIFIAAMLCICMAGCSTDDISDVGNLESKVEKLTESSIQEEKVADECVTEIDDSEVFWIKYLEVGQADAALVYCSGHYMLIDGGNKDDSEKMYRLMIEHSVNSLDMVIASHAHEDHLGGIPGALAAVPADMTMCPVSYYESEAFEDFVKYALLRGGGLTIPKAGDEYELGSACVEILGLNATSEEENDTSIIVKITYGETAFLFTGDAEKAAEDAVLETGEDLTATVLKAGHHGSESSTTESFLNEVKPETVIISAGENEYGHPTKEVLERLDRAGAAIYRTDKNGDILVSSDGKTVTVAVEKEATAEEIMTPGEVYLTDEKQRKTGKMKARKGIM